MYLAIIDYKTRLVLDMIKTYDFVQYVDEFSGSGSFQINVPMSDDTFAYLVRKNFIFFEEGIVGVIESCKDSQDEEKQVIVIGKLTNSILSLRSLLKTERYNTTITMIARSLVEKHFIQPTDEKRRIDCITLATDEKYNPTSEKIAFCDTGTNVCQSISKMFLPYGYGFELYPIVEDYNAQQDAANLTSLEFRVLKPVDRTIDNTEGNTPVVFAFQLNNLSRLEYEEDGSTYCSMAIVASEGTGSERKTLEVGDTEKTGLDRIELYVDARDIQSENEDGTTISDEELYSLMKQRGLEKLEEHGIFLSFSGSVLVSGDNRYVYGKDFYKGDYVSVIDEVRNRIFDLQITSVTKSISQGIEHFDIDFGLDRLTVRRLVG